MAYLQQNDTLLDPNKPQQQQPDQGQGGQSAGVTPNSGGSGQDPFAGSQGVSTAGVGSGGTGGWTNIQAYLNANQGNTGSQDALNKQVGGQFDQEQKQFNDQSSQAKQNAQSEMDRSSMGQDQASKLVSDASKMYSYGTNPQQANSGDTDPYQAIIKQFQTARQGYSGPNSFTYAPDSYAKTQDYGANLGNDQGFGGLMQGIYNQAAGGQLNAGQQALQTQLDTNNPGLQQARQSLMDRYSGLSSGIQQGTQDTNQFLKDASGTVGSNQAALDQYLNQAGAQDQGQLNSQAGIWNKQLQDFANSVSSGRNVSLAQDKQGIDSITPNTAFDATNVAGMDKQRNSWNVIQDIFNHPEQKISQGNLMNPDQVNYHVADPSVTADGTGPIKSTMSFQDILNNPILGQFAQNQYMSDGKGGITVVPGNPAATPIQDGSPMAPFDPTRRI